MIIDTWEAEKDGNADKSDTAVENSGNSRKNLKLKDRR